jgi:hypothetical protein
MQLELELEQELELGHQPQHPQLQDLQQQQQTPLRRSKLGGLLAVGVEYPKL